MSMRDLFVVKHSKTFAVVFILVVPIYLLTFGIFFSNGSDLFGFINIEKVLSGSADLITECKGIKIAGYCLGKLILIGVGP
jgi:hypothetical protein